MQRNRFRRRVRMALLQALKERPGGGAFVLWVRPQKGTRNAGRISYPTILGRLRLVLSRLDRP